VPRAPVARVAAPVEAEAETAPAPASA
jgi:hypothetical protein